MSKSDIRSKLEYQKSIPNVKVGPSWNVKIGLRMSKFDIRSQFECQHKNSNVKISHSARVLMDFESQILIFGPNSNVILGILFF